MTDESVFIPGDVELPVNPQVAIEHERRQRVDLGDKYDPAGDPVIRASGLGGSDMASVLGVDPYRSGLETWSRKRGTWPTYLEDEVAASEPIRLGRELEDGICNLFGEDTGLRLQRIRSTPRHREHLWAMAHPDRKVVGADRRTVVEAKFTGLVDQWGEPRTDQIPERILPQVHHELWVTDSEVCYVPVWLVRFRVERAWFRVERDPEWDEILESAGAAFWTHVMNGTEPPIVYTEPAAQAALEKVYGQAITKDTFVELAAAEQSLVDALEQMSEVQNDAARAVKAIRAELGHRLGEAMFGRLPDGRWLRQKQVTRDAYTVDALTYVDRRVVKSLPKGIEDPFDKENHS